MKKLWKVPSPATGIAIVALLFATGGGAVVAQTTQRTSSPTFTKLTLQNGWTSGPFGTGKPAVALDNGIVVFKGAMATKESNPVPFTLPSSFRPSRTVFIQVDMCNANSGRLQIEPTGVVTVQAQGGAFSNAACFTGLDGATFAK
jgi:hypothetical protein